MPWAIYITSSAHCTSSSSRRRQYGYENIYYRYTIYRDIDPSIFLYIDPFRYRYDAMGYIYYIFCALLIYVYTCIYIYIYMYIHRVNPLYSSIQVSILRYGAYILHIRQVWAAAAHMGRRKYTISRSIDLFIVLYMQVSIACIYTIYYTVYAYVTSCAPLMYHILSMSL